MTIAGHMRKALAVIFLLVLVFPGTGEAQSQPPRTPPSVPSSEVLRQKELEREAAVNLSLAKKSIQDDAFYNARVALNVWRISAVEAGNFDGKLYEDLRKQLYEKSIRDNLRCIDVAVAQRDAPDANLCLKIYRLHSQEIDAFDPKRYEELKARVSSIRKKEK
ncbi:MAG: hypothetical protein ACM3KE_11950 [Hyphomicrobiales bacterium]